MYEHLWQTRHVARCWTYVNEQNLTELPAHWTFSSSSSRRHTVWSRGRDTILEAVVRGRDFWTERKVSPRTCQENNKCKGLRQEGSFQEQECGPWSWSKARENWYIFLNPHVPKLPNCNWAEESWDTGHGSWNGEWEGFYFHLPLTHFSCTCNRILKGTQPAFQPKTPRDVRAQVRKHQRVTTQQARG